MTMYIFNKQKLLPLDWDVLFYPMNSSNLAICFLVVIYIEKIESIEFKTFKNITEINIHAFEFFNTKKIYFKVKIK